MSNPLITRTFFRLSQGVRRGQILPLTNPGFCLWGNHFQHWLTVSQSRVHWAEPPWCQEQAIKGKFTSGLRLTAHGESSSDQFLLRIFKVTVGIMTMWHHLPHELPQDCSREQVLSQNTKLSPWATNTPARKGAACQSLLPSVVSLWARHRAEWGFIFSISLGP